MGFHAFRLTRRIQGNSTTGSLAILAGVSVLGIASFTQFGGALEQSVKGETQASAFALSEDGEMAFDSPGEGAHAPNVELGSSSSAAIDPGLADNLIDYVAGNGSRPSQIPAGSDADEMLDKVIQVLFGDDADPTDNGIVGDDPATKNAVIAALKNKETGHADLEKILFEGINDINEISSEVRNAILEGISKRIAAGENIGLLGEILDSLEELGKKLDGHNGRCQLGNVLEGKAIGQGCKADPGLNNAPADEPAADTTNEPAADEPAADEPAADEPVADEPAADEPAAEVGDSSQAGGSGPEETGKAILDAINASPEASAAAATLLEDPEVIELVSDAASGNLKLDAKSVISLLREKPGIVAVLEALVKDPKVMSLLESQIDPEFLPLLKLLTSNPGLLERLGNYVKNASDADVVLITDLIEQIQEGNFAASDVSKYLPLLQDPAVLSILRDLSKNPAVAQLLEQYIGPAAKILAGDPDLVQDLLDAAASASDEEMDALLDIIDAAQNGNFDPVTDLPKVLTLLGNDDLRALIGKIATNPDALALAAKYVPPSYLRLIAEHPELLDDVANYLANASEADLALVAEVMNDAREGNFSLGKAMELLLNPEAYGIVQKIWNTEAGREAIIDSIARYAPGGQFWGPMLGWPVINRFVPSVARFIGLRNRVGTWNAIKMTVNNWLTDVTGQECSGIFNKCRLGQATGLFAKGVSKVGGWIGGLFGGGDDEPAKAVGTAAREPVTSEGTAMTPSSGSDSEPTYTSAAPAVVAANLPPVLGYAPAYDFVPRQMMRIAAERSLEGAPND